jgi:hypothetical protein
MLRVKQSINKRETLEILIMKFKKVVLKRPKKSKGHKAPRKSKKRKATKRGKTGKKSGKSQELKKLISTVMNANKRMSRQ